MIKICGLTSASDARAAAEAGADALGFVFAPSPRQMTAQEVAEIAAQLPPEPLRVGVFVNATLQELRAAAEAARLTVLQLHGQEPPSLAADLAAALPGVAIWKAVAMRQPDAETQLAAWQPHAAALLLDGGSGGSGERFDWSRAAALGESTGARIIVAGGLDADNVAVCVRRARPWGVDVSSGVERMPGRKDPAKVVAFIQAARAAYAELGAA